MTNIFFVSHILLLFYSPEGSWSKSGKREKLKIFFILYSQPCSNWCLFYALFVCVVIIFSVRVYLSLHFLSFLCFLSVTSFEFDVIFIWLQHLYDCCLYRRNLGIYDITLTIEIKTICKSMKTVWQKFGFDTY